MKRVIITVPDDALVSVQVESVSDKNERTIADLGNGETAYTTPWSVNLFRNGKARIDNTAPAYSSSSGSVTLQIMKYGKYIYVDSSSTDDDKYVYNAIPDKLYPHYIKNSLEAIFVPSFT